MDVSLWKFINKMPARSDRRQVKNHLSRANTVAVRFGVTRRIKPQGNKAHSLLLRFIAIALFVLLAGAIVQTARLYNSRIWRWGNQSILTLVVTGKPVSLLSYKQHTNELIILLLPENVEITGAYEVGNWKTEALYELGKNRGIGGGKLLSLSLQNEFGIPIDGWISPEALQWIGYKDNNSVRSGEKNTIFAPLAWFDSINLNDTNLTLFDRVGFALSFTNVPPSRQKVVRLESLDIVKRVKLPSGELGWVPKRNGSSELIRREFIEPMVVSEAVGVGVINSSNRTGIGKKVSSLLENLGVVIVWVKSEGEYDKHCLIKANDKALQTKTYFRIQRLFSCETSHKKNASADALIEIVIGKEFGK